MRVIEQIDKFTYKEVKYNYHEVRSFHKDKDHIIKRHFGQRLRCFITPKYQLLNNERFFEFWIHPEDEECFQNLIKEDIKGIFWIE